MRMHHPSFVSLFRALKTNLKIFRNLKILAFVLLGCSICFTPAQAAKSCVALTSKQQVPPVIDKNQCFELQGGNVLTGKTMVKGKLFIKAGRNASLSENSIIEVVDGGNFEVRGQLDVEHFAQISIDHKSFFSNSGTMIMQAGSILNSRGSALIRNVGKILVTTKSFIELHGFTTFNNVGYINLDLVQVHLHEDSQLINIGTLILDRKTTIDFMDKSKFINSGKATINPTVTLQFKNYSQFTNKRNLQNAGRISFIDHSILDNNAPFKILKNGYFYLSDSAQALNKHTFENAGHSIFNLRARFLNEGTLAIKNTGETNVFQKAVVFNNGTFRNEGGIFAVEHDENFINENIVAGKQSRSQD